MIGESLQITDNVIVRHPDYHRYRHPIRYTRSHLIVVNCLIQHFDQSPAGTHALEVGGYIKGCITLT